MNMNTISYSASAEVMYQSDCQSSSISSGSFDVVIQNEVIAEAESMVAAAAPRKRTSSFGNIMVCDEKNAIEKRILVIYTGGTIGMMRDENCVLSPHPCELSKRIRDYPNMHDKIFAEKRFGVECNGPLALPRVYGENNRIIYDIKEYNPLLDSSNMTMNDWANIANDIQETYEQYDGFVILHGTDTLSYTASALSFMLENLGKTIVITGSQIPIFETRTDGRDNFVSALIVAANYNIPEVCVLFGNKVLRGNRTVKMSSESLGAFDSPNVVPLAMIGITVDVNYRAIQRPRSVARFTVHLQLDKNVGLLRIFPSITKETILAFLSPPIKGVVLQTFGTGNVPANREDLLKALQDATSREVIIVNCTQCPNGSVSDLYQTGKVLTDIGVLPGYDMTPEAALTKLSYVLGKNWSIEEKKKAMTENLRGELTPNSPEKITENPYNLIDEIAAFFKAYSIQDKKALAKAVLPSLVAQAIHNNDVEKLNILKKQGADMSTPNIDDRTPLHFAAASCNVTIVKQLLEAGVSIHVKDRFSRSPLTEAILQDNAELIQLMVEGGAHISCPGRILGAELCAAAANNAIERIKSYELAGADLSQPDYSGRTALHVAAGHGHENLVRYLLAYYKARKLSIMTKDILGLKPLDYAHRTERTLIIAVLLELECVRTNKIDMNTENTCNSDVKM